MRFLLGSLTLAVSLAASSAAFAQAPPPHAGWGSPPPYFAPLPLLRPVKPEVRSVGMIAAGSLILSFGATLAGVGATILGIGGSECPIFFEGDSPNDGLRRSARERVGTAQQKLYFDCGNHAGIGAAFLIAGNLIAPAGVPLLVLGALRSPPQKKVNLRPVFEVSFGAASGSLRMTF